jgi:hypothetical protein
MIMIKIPMMVPIIPRFTSPPSIRADPQLQIRPLNTILSLTSRSELREASAICWPDPAPSTTEPPQGRMHYTLREVKVSLWKLR